MKQVNSCLILLILSMLLIPIGCDNNPSSTSNPQPQPDKVPTHLVINGQELVLSSFLWRDFMPPVIEEQTRLRAIAKLITVDLSAFPDNVTLDYLWIINDEEIWDTEFTNENYGNDHYSIERIARGGPLWETRINVDVIVKISVEGVEKYLKQTDVYIGETW